MIHPVHKFLDHPLKESKIQLRDTFSHKMMRLIFKMLHLTLGLDFGFFKFQHPKTRLALKVCTFLYNVLLGALFTIYNDADTIYNIVLLHVYMFFYLICATLLLKFKNGTTFCDFLMAIKSVDQQMGLDSSIYGIEKKVSMVIILTTLYRLSLFAFYCSLTKNTCVGPFWVTTLYSGTVISTDLAMITFSFIFYSIRCRLSSLTRILQEENRDYTSLQWIYKHIADITYQYKSAYDGMMLFAVIYHVPEMMMVIFSSYYHLRYVHSLIINLTLPLLFLMITETLILTLFPAIYAGMLTTKAENIKIILHDKLLQEQDDVRRAQIVQFIKYAEARPLALSVYKLIPLNAHLISIVINFCVTYLIVIIQFTFAL